MTAGAFPPVDEQITYLRKGAVEIIREEELLAKLERSRKTESPLTIKVGFDPSAPDLHLGHTVVLRKMKHFQDMGHRVVFLIGDFTGMIGDPTGQSKTRPVLTREQVKQNAATYKKQVFKILHPKKTVVDFNSRWLGKLNAAGFIHLASKYTVARLLERDDFSRRYKGGQPIGLHEFLYPIAQAYDSVALKADVEMGGTDQTFNLLVGREVMREFGLEPQVVLTMPLLEGLDGVEKMSKSLGNYIGINEPPREIYGKAMSISDTLMWRYWELCTDATVGEIAAMRRRVEAGELHPKQAKSDLARRLVADYHGAKAAAEAAAEFEKIFARKETPEEVREVRLPSAPDPVWVPKLLVGIGLAKSNGEARRLIEQGGVYLDGERLSDTSREVPAAPAATYLFKVGKRHFVRVSFG
ncbi:MAG TPA: tyrosine--tRNA ligase [Candidatus Polarisedimenticolia bacterium]|jgi:tyrosyl-tRNA synthetase|nr:tyrosine--tRNA ligase [Candidatus Polarisedimenticolia bacterium]